MSKRVLQKLLANRAAERMPGSTPVDAPAIGFWFDFASTCSALTAMRLQQSAAQFFEGSGHTEGVELRFRSGGDPCGPFVVR